MKIQPYDIIGDIHGHHDKLTNLLLHLGYEPQGKGYRHPAGRQVLFLGDYIDRGPKVREVLVTVRAMVDSGDALAIMGNHEYNAVLYHTPGHNGEWLRPHRENRDDGLRVTLAQFVGREREWKDWLEWMKGLPFFLDKGGFRAVHACWDAQNIAFLEGKSLVDPDFLHASARREGAELLALENVLKGPELKLADGYVYHDKEGHQWSKVRVRWWDLPEAARVGDLAMPEPFDVPGDADPEDLRRLPTYGSGDPPVFFGHYWLPAAKEKVPLAPNVACLDFSAAREGPLVAYRWDGEATLSAGKFVVAPRADALRSESLGNRSNSHLLFASWGNMD